MDEELETPFDLDENGSHEQAFEENLEEANADSQVADPFAYVEKSSQPFIGRWNSLVSQTNWEKGRIICDWRQSLIDADAPITAYSDEAWAKLVGGVTSQHVGRLRRVHQKFSKVAQTYAGLFWTHFHAACDWDDAEMWLEGAVQNSWSVSQMRRKRWETLGAVAADEPEEGDVVAAEVDEDFEPANDREPTAKNFEDDFSEENAGPRAEGPDFGDEEHMSDGDAGPGGAQVYASDDEDAIGFVKPFENLGELPPDVSEAFEAFKLSIIRHRAEEWQSISAEDMLAALDALKELVRAPSGYKR